jgi:hypothetical protein
MHSEPVAAEGTSQASASVAALIAHAKEYGVLYAVAYFVAADLGILVRASELAGGMC